MYPPSYTASCPFAFIPASLTSATDSFRKPTPSGSQAADCYGGDGWPSASGNVLTRVLGPSLFFAASTAAVSSSPTAVAGGIRNLRTGLLRKFVGAAPSVSSTAFRPAAGFSSVMVDDFCFEPSAFDCLGTLWNSVGQLLGSLCSGEPATDQHCRDGFRQYLQSRNLRLEFSCDLITSQSEVRHCLVSRRSLRSDSEAAAFRQAVWKRLAAERDMLENAGGQDRQGCGTTCSSSGPTDQSQGKNQQQHRRQPIMLAGLNSLKPELTSKQPQLKPSITMYVLPVDHEGPVPGTIDTLTAAVEHLAGDRRLNEQSAVWLSTLDRASLMRYVNELTENLLSSVESAFAQGDLFST